MVELVDTLDLGSSAARCEGSSPSEGTMKYVYDVIKAGELDETISVDELAKKRLFKTYVDGNFNRAFMLGFSFEVLLEEDALNRSLLKDLSTLSLPKEVEKNAVESIDEYSECIDGEKLNVLDLINYVLTVLEHDGTKKEDLLKAAFLLGRAFQQSKK